MDDPQRSFFIALERSISKTRLEAYRNGGSLPEALSRYCWNAAICESLYSTFQILEVAYRNAVHIEIGKHSPDWLMDGGRFLNESEQSAIALARSEVVTRRKHATEHLLVAELKFGFWTSLLDVRYDRMWPKIIKGVFPHMPPTLRTRAEMSSRMNKVRKFRNAALHHHSIWHWSDLSGQHEKMHEVTGWICASAGTIARRLDRFPGIHSAGPSAFSEIVSKFPN